MENHKPPVRRDTKIMLEPVLLRLQKQSAALSVLAKYASMKEQNPQTAFSGMTEAAAQGLDLTFCGIWLFNDGPDNLLNYDTYNTHENRHFQAEPFAYSQSPTYFEQIKDGNSVTINSKAEMAILPGFNIMSDSSLSMAHLSAIIRFEGSMVGILTMEREASESGWTRDDHTFAESVANFAAVVVGSLRQREKERFFASLSQEIRTPMQNLLGTIKLFAATNLSDSQIQYVKTAEQSAEALMKMVVDFLNFSLIDGGKMELEHRIFHLRSLLEDALDKVASSAHGKNLDLAMFVDDDVPEYCIGDSGKLQEIVCNLLSNAIRFTSQGHILLRLFSNPDGEKRSQLHFSVEDTGTGVAIADINNLFLPFTRLLSSSNNLVETTGLGLPVCRRLVELMGGNISVSSKPGYGSTFSFTVPMDIDLSRDIKNHLVRDDKFKDLQVLIADGNAASRQATKSILKHWGCTVSEAKTVDEALGAVKDWGNNNGVILADSDLPGGGPEELALRMRMADIAEGNRITILTRFEDVIEPSRLAEGGFRSQISKPIRAFRLRTGMLRTLGLKDSRSSQNNQVLRRKSANSLNVLLAEDNLVNQKVISELLKFFGHRVDTVDNGREALRALACISYDVVLMDCLMPIMDGYEASRAIRAGLEGVLTPKIPIIALTALAMDGDEQRCLAAGMDRYISKPVKPEILRSELERIVAIDENVN